MDTTLNVQLQDSDWADNSGCTLPTVERPLRVAEFDNLFRSSVRAVERNSRTSARLLMVGAEDLAARTKRLADAESSCCAFFTFTVTTTATGQVAFDVVVPTAYVDVLDALVARAEAIVAATT